MKGLLVGGRHDCCIAVAIACGLDPADHHIIPGAELLILHTSAGQPQRA
jgi:hypothetical protein